MEKRIIELYRRKFDDIRHEEDGRPDVVQKYSYRFRMGTIR